MKKLPELIESSKFVSHRARMSGEFDSKKDSHSTKFEQRPQIFLKLSFRRFQNYLVYILLIIPNFRVSTAILNITDISCKWCKFNFGPLQGQVKLCHFPERIDARRQNFYFLYKFLGMIGRKRLEQPF